MWGRHFSAEAIASALAPKTQTWFRGEGRKIKPEDAAMALAGIEPIPRAFLLVSWGHAAPGDLACCRRHLTDASASKAEADRWPTGRIERFVEMALAEIQHAQPADELERASKAGIGKSQWHRLWKSRYRRILGDAMRQIGRAHEQMARRMSGDE